VLSQKYNLANVVGVVHQLSIDGLNNRMLFAANQNLFSQVFSAQRLERVKDALPTAVPVIEHRVLSGFWIDDKFHVAVAAGLFTVGSQKVGPAREHVAGHVLHDDSNAVALLVERDEKLIVVELLQGLLGKLLVGSQTRDGVFKIMFS